MFRALLSLLAVLLLAGCTRPGDSAARRAHELLETGRFEEARTLIDTSLKETPDSLLFNHSIELPDRIVEE